MSFNINLPDLSTLRLGPQGSGPRINTAAGYRDGTRDGSPPTGDNDPASLNQAANAIDPNSWQATLGAEFDLVETFDHIQDWRGGFGASVDQAMMPKLTTGATTDVWGRYTNDRISAGVDSNAGFQPAFNGGESVTFNTGVTANLWKTFTEGGTDYLQMDSVSGPINVGDTVTGDTSGATATVTDMPHWIADHGDYTFQDGKSACINYNDFSNGIDGFGPSRLEVFLGNGQTGKSGYQKIHVFFMLKFGPNFFNQDGNGDFNLVGTLKFMEVETGFTAVDHYGTTAEHATVVDKPKFRRDYGTNMTFINCTGGGTTLAKALFFDEHRYVARTESGGWGYEKEEKRRIGGTVGEAGDWSAMYLAGQWMGVEMILDCGTVDNADARSVEMYIYDENGVEQHHVAPATGQVALKHFDHRYNKIVMGGNRLCTGYGNCPAGQDSRYYIDDFIVHSGRIAPTYFQKLAERLNG